MLGAILFAFACGAPEEPVSAVARAEAMREGSPAACAILVAAGERGACLALGAHRTALAGDPEAAWRVCGDMPAGAWRDECHFLVTDAAEVVGPDAKRWCQQAGAYRLQCIGHALAREAQTVLERHPRGAEQAASEALFALAAEYVGEAHAPEKARRLLVDHLVARDPDRPFHAGVCGSAPSAVCRDAYIERVRRAAERSRAPWRAACGRVVSVERASQAGQPLWEADAAEVVASAWARLCTR